MPSCSFTVTTPANPGAVAILQLHGPDATDLVQNFHADAERMPVGTLRLVDFAGLDTGLLARVAEPTWQLMSHGGPRIVQQLTQWLAKHGAAESTTPDPAALYPEATSPIEADALAAIATAASPAAIDRLAQQPELWRKFSKAPQALAGLRRATLQFHRALQHLLTPPTVVVVGPPNAGKSTLLNALAGRNVALVADLPGTTRDWVGGLIELTPPHGDPLRDAVAVRWLDTPGLRDSDDPIEQRAIAAARRVIDAADVLIALRDPDQPWPDLTHADRAPDLWVMNKADLLEGQSNLKNDSVKPGAERSEAPDHANNIKPPNHPDHPLRISAQTGTGLGALAAAVLDQLGLQDIPPDATWAFSPMLQRTLNTGTPPDASYLDLA